MTVVIDRDKVSVSWRVSVRFLVLRARGFVGQTGANVERLSISGAAFPSCLEAVDSSAAIDLPTRQYGSETVLTVCQSGWISHRTTTQHVLRRHILD